VPAALGWMVGRFIENISREWLAFTLTATRKAVLDNFRAAALGAASAYARKK
jgi:hypothetical protein